MVRYIAYLIFLLAILSVPTNVLGQPRVYKIPATLYCVDGPYAVSYEHCVAIARAARRLVRQEFKVYIRFVEIKRYASLFSEIANNPTRGAEYVYAARDLLPNNRMQFVLAPPFLDEKGATWTLGNAIGYCRPQRGVAFSTASYGNHRGENRYNHSIVAMAHELAHLLGAWHYNPPSGQITMMHENVLAYVDQVGIPPWDDINYAGVRGCMRAIYG